MESVPGRSIFDDANFHCAPVSTLLCTTCRGWVDVLWLGDRNAQTSSEYLAGVPVKCAECILQELPEAQQQDWMIRVLNLRTVRHELHLERLNPLATLLADEKGWDDHGTQRTGPNDAFAVYYDVIAVILGASDLNLSEYSEFPGVWDPVAHTNPKNSVPYVELRVNLGWDVIHPEVPEAELCFRWNPNSPQGEPDLLVRNWRKVSNRQLGLLVTKGMRAMRKTNRGGAPPLTPESSLRELQAFAELWNKHHDGPPSSRKEFREFLPGNPSDEFINKRIRTAGLGDWENYRKRHLPGRNRTRVRHRTR